MNSLLKYAKENQVKAASWAVGRCAESIKLERLDYEPGVAIVKSCSKSNDILTEYSDHEGNERQLIITFGLSGKSDFTDAKGKILAFNEDFTTVSVFQSGRGERRYSAGQKVEQLRLVIAESALINLVGEQKSEGILGTPLRAGESFRRLGYESSRSSPHLHFFRSSTLGDKQSGLNQRIHALSLLSEQLVHYIPQEKQGERITERELESVARIDTFMRANLDRPINNAYLCSVLGVSEYKLKACFKRVYNSSPAQYLLEIRMKKAWELLESGYQVAETAYRVGYMHPSNFSTAFTRFFNCSPKSVRSCLS